jgi:capsular exopolysaccharide synthesis family protein
MNQLNHYDGLPQQPVVDLPKESFDIKAIFFQYLSYWPYFLLSTLVTLSAAYLFNRYAAPLYNIHATLLIKDTKSGSSGANDFLEGFQLLRTSRNMENEIGIMRSYSMAAATVKQLDFGVSYYLDGNVRTSEMYGYTPIRVEVDSTHQQLLGILFEVEPINEREYTIKVLQPSSWVDNILKGLGLVSEPVYPFQSGTYTFGEYLEADQYRFRIQAVERPVKIKSAIQFRINSPDGLAWTYAGKVNVVPINKGATILNLGMQTTVPAKDAVYLNKFMETYIQAGLDEKNMIAKNTIRFINEQLDGVSDSLISVEDRLQQFRTANRAIDLSEAGDVVFQRLNELEKQQAVEEVKARYYENLIAYVNRTKDFKDVVAPSVLGIEDNLTNTLIRQLIELYTKRNSLSFSATDRNTSMVEFDAQIRSLTQQLLENVRNVIQLNRTTMEDIRRRIRVAEGEINKLPKTQRDLVNIKRKFSLNENLYVYLLQKRAEAGIARASNLPDSKVVDYAVASGAVYPNKSGNYRNAFLLGLLLPGLVIFLKGYLNDTVSNREELEALTSIPILGVVAHSNKETNLVVSQNPKSAVSETFRSLRSNLKYLASDRVHKTILITSGISGEGKTFCSINLASVLALSEKKTILVGVDLRKPRIFNDFGLNNDLGLSNYLIGKSSREEVIQSTSSPSLDVITSGPMAPNPSELLMNGRIDVLLAELRQHYEYIILDSPPLGLVADSFELIRHSDVILYVIRQSYTKRKSIHTITDLYKKGVVKNVSLVLNDFIAQKGQGYGYGYGYGYTYGYGYYEDDHRKRPLWKRLLTRSSSSNHSS